MQAQQVNNRMLQLLGLAPCVMLACDLHSYAAPYYVGGPRKAAQASSEPRCKPVPLETLPTLQSCLVPGHWLLRLRCCSSVQINQKFYDLLIAPRRSPLPLHPL
jgi:hypothetical protein